MITTEDVGDDRVLVSHSNDHFVLSVREARELRDQLNRQLNKVPIEFDEEDG